MSVFSKVSEENLKGVHPDLVKVMREAIKDTPIDFRIIDGLRTLEEQKKFVASGASMTLRSRHLTGKAVDVMALVGGKGRWETSLYVQIGEHVKRVANRLDIQVTWGGEWHSFPDWGHFELNVKKYGY